MGIAETIESRLVAGREALERFAWSQAYDLLIDPELARSLKARDLEGLGEACWWVAQLDDAISARERAFSAYMKEGDELGAGRTAIYLAKDYFARKSSSTGMAWFKRAEDLLSGKSDSIEHGWLVRTRAVLAHEGDGDYSRALKYAEEAFAIGTKVRDRELMAVSLLDQGRALVALGKVDEGLPLMEEATVAAVSGELRPLWTATIYCNIISQCEELADYRRAGEWSDAAKRWCERQSIAGVPGMCRVYRAGIMRLRGEWLQAETEARKASEELRDFNVSYSAEAFYEIGEVRLRLGDFASAQDAFEQANALGRDPQPGMAILRSARGDLDGAESCITRALEEESRPLHRAKLLPARVEISIARNELENAAEALEELNNIATEFKSTAIRADTAAAEGALALARGDATAARQSLKRAWRGWQEVKAPYESAKARALLGQALFAGGDEESARLEWRAAQSAFESLGVRMEALKLAVPQEGWTERSAADSQRALRTFMMTDIVKSTNLVEALGDDAWHDVVNWHDRTLRSLFGEHNGEEIDHAGDGFFVAFADADCALDCAIAIQRRLSEHRRTHGFAPSVRIGLHRTTAIRVGVGYKGKGVHEAARIAALADGGEIRASAESVTSARSRYPLSDAESIDLKGIAEPVSIVSVDWR